MTEKPTAPATASAVILRAYTASTPGKAADLVVTEASEFFQCQIKKRIVDPRTDPDLAYGAEGKTWNFQRLELVIGDAVLILPTLSVEGDPGKSKEDRYGILSKTAAGESLLSFRCHSLCLIGGSKTAFGLKLDIFRKKDSSGQSYSTMIASLELGDAKPGIFHDSQRWLQLANILTGESDPYHWGRLPYENVDNTDAGPFLKKADENVPFEQKRVLEIKLVFIGRSSRATLQVAYRSSEHASGYRVNGIDVPVDGHGIYLTQRASDDWISGTSGPQWKIDIRSPLYSLWNSELERYRSSLKTARSVNRLTFLPRLAERPELNLLIQCAVDVESPGPNVSASQLKIKVKSAYPELPSGGPVPAEAIFDSLFPNGVSYNCVLSPLSQSVAGSLSFQMTFPARNNDPTFIEIPKNGPARVGSLDLTFGGEIAREAIANSEFALLDLSSQTSKMPRFTAKIFLPLVTIDPAGQDGLPGSEYVPENYDGTGSQNDTVEEIAIEEQFQGSAPLVIAVGAASNHGGDSVGQSSPKSQFWAEVNESNPELYSQTVSIKLHSLPDVEATGGGTAPDSGRQVIVLDSDPFLVAEVRFDGLHRRSGGTSSDVIAIWNMNRVDGAGWELYTNLEPFRLVIPPQSLGEEMPKGRELEDKYNPQSGVLRPLEFRIGPPAVETLEASYTPQNYTEAPWNLRRILGYPGQRDAGAGVKRLQYELLYGLSCVAQAPMLRLAEIFATLGRIPGRLQVLPKPLKGSPPTLAYQSYLHYRTRWANYYGLYKKRVAILEPRFSGANYGRAVGVQGASATPEVFTLEDGIQCTFRSSASLYYRAQSEVNAGTPVDQDEFNVDPNGLRGGATWGFEAPRIYHATLRNPNSSSAKLVNPYFSALGGSGYQKVSFDRGLTSVYSNTEIGRTFYYSVERMGRIGIFHNLARHVIEYERSVAPGPQFSASQTAFCGGPVLRKMREYVQILEPRIYLSAGNTPYPECGCAKAIEFKTEIVPVDSNWGANVGESGWKIPLWKRSAGQAPAIQAAASGSPAAHGTKKKAADSGASCLPPPYSYSKPEVVFDMAGFDGADVECAITDPEKLYFYTETKENSNPDPHEWSLIEALDFSLAAIPTQNPAFQSSTVNEISAYDATVPSGLSAFTFHLDPGHGPVNLVQGRTVQPLGSVLQSVTFQRPANIASKPDLQRYIEAATKAVRQDLFAAIRTGDTQTQQQAKSQLSTILSSNLQATLDAYINSQKNQLTGPAGQLLSRVQGNFIKWSTTIDTELKAYQEDWSSQWKRIAGTLTPQNYKLRLKAIADNEVDALFARIEALPVSINPLGRLCVTIDRALDTAASSLNNVVAAFDRLLSQEAKNADLEVSVLGSQIHHFTYDVHATLDQLRVAIQSAIESWMPGVGLFMHFWEVAIFGVVSQMDSLVGNLALKVSDVQGYLQKLKAPTALLDSFRTDLEKKLKDLNLTITDLLTEVQRPIESVHKSVRDTIESLIDNFALPVDPALVQSAILSLANQAQSLVANQLESQLKALLNSISQSESVVLNVLIGLPNDASAAVTNALAEIIPGGTAEALEAGRKKAEDALGRYVDSLLTNLKPQIDLKLPGGNVVDTVLQRAFGAAPQVPNLNFSLPAVGYFYLPGVQTINLTPLLTQVSGLGSALSPLGSMLPSTAILDRMLPSDLLKNFNLSDVLPNFAGLKLDSLFSGLKMPSGADKYIKISHGLDQSSRRAWVQADINFSTDTVATLFTIGPIALQLPKATFACQVKLQADASGQIVKQATGAITGDWTLIISGTPLVTMTSTSLSFDEQGHVHFNVSPDRVVLAQALNFIEQIIASYSSPDSGFSIVPSPTGIETRLDLPIPNTSGGTTGITNLTIGFSFGLQFAPFAITAGFNLGRKKAPFNIMVFILGGAGYVETDLTFVPGKQLQCSVTIELAASASLAIAFGPISGYVAIFLGMSINFQSGAGSDLRLGIFIQVIGEVSILSIVSAYVGLRLEATYENGTFTGRGQFTISIKICWCFTLDVDEHVEFTVGGGGGGRSQHEQLAFNEPPRLFASNEPISDTVISMLPRVRKVDYLDLATAYISMIS